MSKDRLLDLCNNTIVWADEHSRDLASDLIKGMGITSDELLELGFDKKNFSYLHEAVGRY